MTEKKSAQPAATVLDTKNMSSQTQANYTLDWFLGQVNCENRDEMDPYQDGFLSLPRIGPVIYMKCPKPQIFSTSHIDHINPQIRTIPSDHK